MAEHEEIVKEYEVTRKRYRELLAKLIELGVPGVIDIDKVAAKCSVGEVCHGGEFRNPLEEIVLPGRK